MRLHGQQQRRQLGRGDLREFHITQGGIYPADKVALIAGAGVLAHGDGLGRHEHPLPILAQREYLCGLPLGLRLPFPLLRPGDDLSGVALTLKLGGDVGKLPVDGFLAPSFRGIPPPCQVGFSSASADPDFIEHLTSLIGFLPGGWHSQPPVCSALSSRTVRSRFVICSLKRALA